MSVGGVMVNSGDRIGEVTVVSDNKDEEWHRWTGLYLSLSRCSLSFGELCSCDMWVCSKETCQNDHWSENELHCQRASTLHAAQTDTNTANARTHTHIHNNTWKGSNTLLVCLSTHWNVNHSTYPIQRGADSKDTEPRRHSWTHMHVYTVNVFEWGAVCVPVWRCYWIIHLSLVRTSKLSARWEREERKREREREGEVEVGGLERETKTQDEQWWEGQRRSNGWLNYSSHCLPDSNGKHILYLSACPQLSVYVFGQWHMTEILGLSSFIFVMFLYFFLVSLQITSIAPSHCQSTYYSPFGTAFIMFSSQHKENNAFVTLCNRGKCTDLCPCHTVN